MKKLIGTVMIKFYGEDKASVEYETEVSDKVQKEGDLLQLFTLYYAKMLYNLDRGEDADRLIAYIRKAAESVLSGKRINRANILASGQKLVKAKTDGITKKYSGELLEKSKQIRIVQTNIDSVGEGYYIPVSTIMFLQFLIKNLLEGSLNFLFIILGGMDKYYREVGDYSNVNSVIEAPNYGSSLAVKLLKK